MVRVLHRIFFASFRTAEYASVNDAGCRAYNREREAAAERRRAAEADAYARSRKILEEELARDRAWRDAVKQVWRELVGVWLAGRRVRSMQSSRL